MLREHGLHTVCEEASCPNIGECFGKGTATFMILGDLCTRRCPFCDVAHGKPLPPDADEPENLARSIDLLKLKYVVITSVDRDDLRDGGAQHFADCLTAIRASSPATRLEILVPDFRGRLEEALDALSASLPDVLNHNLETVPRLYKLARPGADYAHSLKLLKDFKARFPHIPTKSGLMLGLGETDEEVLEVMRDLRAHDVNMLTIGQYLQPSDGQPAGTPLRDASGVRGARKCLPAARWVCARGKRSAGPFLVSRRPPGAGGWRRVTGSRVPQLRSID